MTAALVRIWLKSVAHLFRPRAWRAARERWRLVHTEPIWSTLGGPPTRLQALRLVWAFHCLDAVMREAT